MEYVSANTWFFIRFKVYGNDIIYLPAYIFWYKHVVFEEDRNLIFEAERVQSEHTLLLIEEFEEDNEEISRSNTCLRS